MDETLKAQRFTVALAFFFNFGYLMFAFLVPLYAASLGYSLAAIGLVAASPALVQIPLRLVSGPLADTWGERRLFALLFISATLAGIIINVPLGVLGPLLVAQCSLGIGRGIYWNTIQSYLTRFPDKNGKWLGLYTTSTNAGAFCGIVAAGPISMAAGFMVAFLLTSSMQVVGMILAFRLPQPPHERSSRTLTSALTRLPRAMGRRELWLAASMAILAALPQALSQSFWPVYLVHSGNTSTVASMVVSLRNIGAMSAGLLAAPILVKLGRKPAFIVTAALLLIGIGGAAFSTSAPFVGASILLAGFSAGIITVLYVMLAGSASLPADHATGFAVVNLFFAATMLVTPLGFGFAASALTVRWTFVVLAVAALIVYVVAGTHWEGWWEQRQSATKEASVSS